MTDPQERGEVRDARDARDAADVRDVREDHVRSVRLGHGANCSSVGSVIDTLFLGAALGGMVFAAVCAAMKVEGITVVGNRPPPAAPVAATDEDAHEDAHEDEATP